MKPNLDQLQQQRQAVLQEMQAIDRLRRGSLSEQFFAARAGTAKPSGPYYVLQGYFQGKKFSHRVPKEQVAQVQADVKNYQRFQTLAETCVTLSDQITGLQDGLAGGKKNSSRKRSPPRSSKKPPPS